MADIDAHGAGVMRVKFSDRTYFGDADPSGKRTLTWPMHQEHLPYTGPDSHYRDTVCEFGASSENISLKKSRSLR